MSILIDEEAQLIISCSRDANEHICHADCSRGLHSWYTSSEHTQSSCTSPWWWDSVCCPCYQVQVLVGHRCLYWYSLCIYSPPVCACFIVWPTHGPGQAIFLSFSVSRSDFYLPFYRSTLDVHLSQFPHEFCLEIASHSCLCINVTMCNHVLCHNIQWAFLSLLCSTPSISCLTYAHCNVI